MNQELGTRYLVLKSLPTDEWALNDSFNQNFKPGDVITLLGKGYVTLSDGSEFYVSSFERETCLKKLSCQNTCS